ncbi:FadR/GntR family transcriptional regulator [Azospirillum sp. SYSU D00513]|uniref:FCD domain-containing protein n=1 Tax=Azospirillum sp. SYSU D00513 TaxID=2812561 RepID=UPI001A975BEF
MSEEGMSRVESVILTVGQWIVSGVHAPGEALPTETELVGRLRVGRNAVREAVKVLAAKGLVRTERRAGTIVEPKTRWNMMDREVLSWSLANPAIREQLLAELTDVRRIIEPEAAALAATAATTPEMLRLFEACDLMQTHVHDAEKAIASDILFHERLFLASHNQLLISLFQSFAVLLRSNFRISIHYETGYIQNIEEHRHIAEAIARRDPEGARRAMHHLLTLAQANLGRAMMLLSEGGGQGTQQ